MLSLACLVSCNKDEIISQAELKPSEQIFTFQDLDAYHQAIKELNGRTFEEIQEWSSKKNFRSFGLARMEFYIKMDPEEFKNKKEALSFINENKKYIYSYYDEGELTVEPIFMEHIQVYFANKDLMYGIGDMVYKLLPNAIIETSLDNIEKLKNVTSVHEVDESKSIYIAMNSDKSTPDLRSNCGNNVVQRYTVGKNRVKIELTAEIKYIRDKSDLIFQDIIETEYYLDYLFRPYKRTLGIWFYCKRTIDAELVAVNTIELCALDGTNNLYKNWVNVNTTYQRFHPRLRYSYKGELFVGATGANCKPADYFFDAFYASANTPDISKFHVECDVEDLVW